MKSQRRFKPSSKKKLRVYLQYRFVIYLHAKHLAIIKFLNGEIAEVELVWSLCMEKWKAGFVI